MLKHFGDDEKGILSYMELTDLKFIPRRMYYITKVPKGEIRGKHGCLQGKVKVDMVSKRGEETVVLYPGDSIYIDRMIWAQQQYLSGDDILLVLCSTKHSDNDKFSDKNKAIGG